MKSVDDNHRVTLALDSHFASTAMAASALRDVCRLTALQSVAINRLELCLVEIVNNVIIHAYDTMSGHLIEIEMTVSPAYIAINVSDWGKTMTDQQRRLQAPANTPTTAIRGRGLFIVRKLMDTVSYTSIAGKNCWRMTMTHGR